MDFDDILIKLLMSKTRRNRIVGRQKHLRTGTSILEHKYIDERKGLIFSTVQLYFTLKLHDFGKQKLRKENKCMISSMQ